ncbi:hypothetical protein BSKO_09951 [Bryopsis sp. KO-2023]|nr:hypothetical protein BSKO_09951 [Bryopsis sp. KO-2023]
MFTTCLGGSGFAYLPPRGGRTRRRKPSSRRDSATGKQTSSTSGNVKSSGSTKPVGAPVGGNWFSEQWAKYTEFMGTSVGDIKKKSQKFEVPVKVDVDWVKPTLTSMQEMATESWEKLPPGVQRLAPYLGISLLTGFLVQKLNNRRVNAERHRNEELQTQIVDLLKENKSLEKEIKGMKMDAYSSPQFANQAKMAAAVAQATTAAAQAAEAAATAAKACGIRIRKAVPQNRDGPAAAPVG